ncbi:MAG: metal ABC transporter ATP-binding protein [Muribaculaceae bacterium]|nr:metal ABC transporter ATP-binding protein [Muribaculaceae bacterium]
MKLPGHSDPCLCAACSHRSDRKPLLSLCGVNFSRQGRTVLSDVNLTVDHGDFIAITGPNGGGKTTLLRLILGLLKPDTGRVVHFDAQGRELSSPHSDFRPGYLPQKNSVDSHFPVSVRQVVASGFLGIDREAAAKEERIDKVLEMIELRELADRPIGRLSGGQLQRALFGRAIVKEPSVLILDEPLSYIDARFEKHLYSIVADIVRESTILLVSHQMSEIAGMANRHIIVDHTLRECTHTHHYIPGEC